MKIAYNPKTEAALTAAPSNNDITFDLSGMAIYVKGVKFDGKAYSTFKKHTSNNNGGYSGLVPIPSYTTTTERFLREDGTWTTPDIVTTTTNGLMSYLDKIKLDSTTLINQAIPYIIGPETDTTAGKWTGSYTGITAYTEGLTIIYVPAVAGASTTTLDINGLGAKTCYYSGTSKLTTHFAIGTPIMLTYSGGGWRRADYNSIVYTSAYCTTSASTAAKTASCSNYTLLAKSYIHVLIRYTNTAAKALTMNINSNGAKPIYINGAASSASNYNLLAGTYIVYYDGTNFYFRTDGTIPGIVEQSLISNTTNSLKVSELNRTNFDFLPHSYGEGLTSWYTAVDTPSGTCSGLTLKHSNYFVWQLSSDCKISTTDYNKNNLYFRSGGLNSTNTLVWGGWKTILDSHNWTDYIDLTKFYWANIPISTESNEATAPKVSYLLATNGINTSYIRSSSNMSISSAYNITLSANDSSVIKIADTFINPLKDDTVNLGTAYDRWSGIYTKSLTTESLNYRCKGSSEYPKMYFYNNTWTYLGFFGMNYEKKFVIADQSGYSSNYVLHSGNSSVSGGGSTSGSSLTVTINGKSATLTIPEMQTPSSLYWANIAVDTVSSTDTTPTFASVTTKGDLYANRFLLRYNGNSGTYADLLLNLGTTTQSGVTYLILGNSLTSTLNNNASGYLYLYGSGSKHASLSYKGTSKDSNLVLPVIKESISRGELLYHEPGKQIGNATTPVYVNSRGEVVACNPYPTASGLSLEKTLGINGLDYVFHAPNSDATTSIYAPTISGTNGLILQSTGSGAPSWTSRLSFDYPGILWVGYIFRDSRSSAYYYTNKLGGKATLSLTPTPNSSYGYLSGTISGHTQIMAAFALTRAVFGEGSTVCYAYSDINFGKAEEAGFDNYRVSFLSNAVYIRACCMTNKNNSSWNDSGFLQTGTGDTGNSRPIASLHLMIIGY